MPTRSTRTRKSSAAARPFTSPVPAATKARKTATKPSSSTSTRPTGGDLVGHLVEIEWPSPGTKREFFGALVVGYTPRRKEHKVIYLDEECVESLELDKGCRNARAWREIKATPTDDMIGSMLKIVDNETGSEDSWFDFMRQHPNRKALPFYVFVVAAVQDPDLEEVSGPQNVDDAHVAQHYRVIHAPNEYVTTVDLASVDYIVHTKLKRIDDRKSKTDTDTDTVTVPATREENETKETEEQVDVDAVELEEMTEQPGNNDNNNNDDEEPVAQGEEVEVEEAGEDVPAKQIDDAEVEQVNVNDQEDRDQEAQPEEEEEEEDQGKMDVESPVRSRVNTTQATNAKAVDVIPDDEDLPETIGKQDVSPAPVQARGTRRRRSPVADREAEAQQPNRKARRNASADEEEEDEEEETSTPVQKQAMNDAEQNSPATADTREDPILLGGSNGVTVDVDVDVTPKRLTMTYGEGDEEEDDEESENKKEVGKQTEVEVDGGNGSGERHVEIDTELDDQTIQSIIGDYILVDVGNGQKRKAYVETYLPSSGNHFLAFCDERGGDVQLKLTEENYSVLDDKQAAMLTRDQARSKVGGTVVDIDDMFGAGNNNNNNNNNNMSSMGQGQEGDTRQEADEEEEEEEEEEDGVEIVDEGKKRRTSRRAPLTNSYVRRDAPDEQYEEEEEEGEEEEEERGGGGSKGKKTTGRQKGRWTGSGGRSRRTSQKVLGKTAGAELLSRCITVLWPNTKLVYVALVVGFSEEARQHMLLYMVDQCVEILDLKYREWQMLPRGQEPWNASGMVGKRIFVWWAGEYNSAKDQRKAAQLFGGDDKTKVAYEAFILNFIGQGVYKILYPCNEDTEERELLADTSDGDSPLDKDWDILPDGVNDVMGLPIVGWEG